MSDRHVRRSGSDYREAFFSLLPNGQAWPKHAIGSILWETCDGLCEYWGFVDGRAADLLERESDPRQTVELLSDWERNWGLPDPCWSQARTVDQRQNELVLRMTLMGGQSRQWFINISAYLGYTITITEYRPFMVGMDRCGDNRVYGDGTNPMFNNMFVRGYLPVCDPNGQRVALGVLSEYPNYGLGPDTNRYFWTVHVHTSELIWFRCGSGQCGIDPFLRIGYAKDLECILNRWKPAHTQIIFDYTGVWLGQGTSHGVGGVNAVSQPFASVGNASGHVTTSATGRTAAAVSGHAFGVGAAIGRT
jgi:uncharacterized protein YmfQ (DUF2313 family)